MIKIKYMLPNQAVNLLKEIPLDGKERPSFFRHLVRQVIILECDNEVLEEIISYKGMGEFVKERIATRTPINLTIYKHY